jgi:hypothetical protein
MRRLALLTAAIVGLGFPAGLGLAVYMASGSTFDPPPVSARVPTGTIARPSTPPVTTTTDGATTTDETTTDDTTTEADTTTTEADEDSGRGRGRGQGRGRNRGHGGDD